jgi:hypothetical protein
MKVLHKELPYGKKLYFTLMNSRTIEVSTDAPITKIEYTEGLDKKISKIFIGDYCIKLLDKFKIPIEDQEYSVTYEANSIVKVTDDSSGLSKFLLTSHERNKTSVFLLPVLPKLQLTKKLSQLTLPTKIEISKYCYNTYLINAYISQHNHGTLTLVYRFSNHQTYKLFEECMLGHTRLVKVSEGKSDFSYVLFEVQVETAFKEDVIRFLQGKYSQLSDALKSRILSFHNANKSSSLYGILHKTEAYRKFLSRDLNYPISEEMELGSKPDITKEYWYE